MGTSLKDLLSGFNENGPETYLFMSKSAKLMDVLFQDKGIQYILDAAYELLGNPLMLTDASYKMLSCTKNIETSDPFWNELVSDGYFSYETMLLLRKHRIHELINKSDSPVFLGKDKFPVPRILSRIMIDNKFMGQLCILENGNILSEKDIGLFSILCSIVACEMQKNKFVHQTKGLIYETFIADILDGKIRDMGTVKDRIKYLDLMLRDNLYVLSISTLYVNESECIPVQYLRSMLEQIVAGSKSVIYNDYIVMLLSLKDELSLKQPDMVDFLEFLKKNHIRCGLSRRFKNLIDLRENYEQSVKAINYGMQMSKDKFLFLYEDHTLYHLFDLSSAQGSLESFCHTSIRKLEEYDREHHTRYMVTLYTYLNNSRRPVETANMLKIHRNTLASRLETIREIIDTDFNDPNINLQLLLSFQILRFLDKTSMN